MSPENRLQTEYFLEDINQEMIKAVADSRGLSLDSMATINDQMLVREAEDAVTYNLVNRLTYEDEVHAILREKLGLDEDDDIPTINATDLGSLAKSKNLTSKNRIAVILAEGEIVSGSVDGVISSDKFAKEIRKARKDDDIKAIVLRG